MVTSRSSAPSRGCQVRSRCSSSSCGSRRLTARIIIITYSAMGRLKTPRALVITRPRSRLAGVRTRSTPADAEWTHARRGARASRRSKTSAERDPRSSASTSSSGPSARPSTETVTIRAPGAACRIHSRSRARHRADRIGLRAMAEGTPSGPAPGPAAPWTARSTRVTRPPSIRRSPGPSRAAPIGMAPRSRPAPEATPARPTGVAARPRLAPGRWPRRTARPSDTAPS
jgi:hypothetical protein